MFSRLRLISTQDEEEVAEEDEDTQRSTVDNYTGVSIKVITLLTKWPCADSFASGVIQL